MADGIKSAESLADSMKSAKLLADRKEKSDESLEVGMNKPEDEVIKDPEDNENEEGRASTQNQFFVGSQGDVREEEEVDNDGLEDHETYCLDGSCSCGGARVHLVLEDKANEVFYDQKGAPPATAVGSSNNR